jgi:uncharacterized protein with PQ loop repeat
MTLFGSVFLAFVFSVHLLNICYLNISAVNNICHYIVFFARVYFILYSILSNMYIFYFNLGGHHTYAKGQENCKFEGHKRVPRK